MGYQKNPRNAMKRIYSGLESSGKSLKLAMDVTEIVARNAKWARKSGIVRPIWSNLHFSREFYDYATKEMGIPIHYWSNLDTLIQTHDADIVCDEVGNYFDSRLWADLSLDVRRWLSQGAKQGIEFYGTAQDFAQVDKAFRRLCNELFLIKKIIGSRRPSATKPPVKYIWGVCLKFELDPNAYDEDKKKFIGGGLPGVIFIQRKYCDIFDTKEKIERSLPPLMKHIERHCENNDCTFHKIAHV